MHGPLIHVPVFRKLMGAYLHEAHLVFVSMVKRLVGYVILWPVVPALPQVKTGLK